MMALTRLIYKRVVSEAADARTMATQAASSQRAGVRMALLAALWSHIMFAEVGARLLDILSAEFTAHSISHLHTGDS